MKRKNVIIFILLCLSVTIVYRFIFCYTIVSWGSRYKHKIASVEVFPHCFINPFYYDKLKNNIEWFLNYEFEKYHQKEYPNTKDFYGMNNGFKKTGFDIVSIRETNKKEIIEILVFQNVKDYSSVIFIFDKKMKKVVGFY